MTLSTKTTIKTYFETGDYPTQSNFGDFIDSCIFAAETSAQSIATLNITSVLSATTAVISTVSAQTGAFGTATTTTPAQGDSSATVPTTAWLSQNMPGGAQNKFDNGTMAVWQRGTSGTVTAGSDAITADRWYLSATGANGAWSQQTGLGNTRYSLAVTGGAGVTLMSAYQRLESFNGASLAGKTVTVQLLVKNLTGGTITPTLFTYYANATDNWSGQTADLGSVSLQSVLNNATTRLSYTFTVSTNAINGYQVVFSFGNNFSSGAKSVEISEVDIRVTPGIATGLNSAPPPVELRNVSGEFDSCLRQYYKYNGRGAEFNGNVTSASVYFANYWFPVLMRTTPTIGSWSNVGNNNFPNTQGAFVVNAAGAYEQRTANGTGAGTFASNFSASAEL